MTRSEHLAWCKKRALEYVERGDLKNALASFTSDLRKHEDTEGMVEGGAVTTLLATEGVMAVQQGDASRMRRLIEGTN